MVQSQQAANIAGYREMALLQIPRLPWCVRWESPLSIFCDSAVPCAKNDRWTFCLCCHWLWIL